MELLRSILPVGMLDFLECKDEVCDRYYHIVSLHDNLTDRTHRDMYNPMNKYLKSNSKSSFVQKNIGKVFV